MYEKDFITLIANAVNKKVINSKDSCTTQGKIYLYGKGGAVETIYFSRINDCMTLSFIKTGEKYYTDMNKKIKETLDELEKKAIVLPGKK